MIASTILNQIGGRKFVAMTGAKDFIDLKNGLQFRLPSTRHYTRDGINSVRVILDADDTYTVEFWKVRGINAKQVRTVDQVYADNLQHVFTTYTGLDTHL